MENKYRLLIVDDEDDIRESCAKAFCDRAGCIDTVKSAEEAEELVKKGEYDAILLDIELPGKNGIELLKDIRLHYPAIQVIIITGRSTSKFAIEAMKSGAYDYVVKPFSLDRIRKIVEDAVRDRM
ncbi:MAG: response regulator [Elusimicrobia bacterium]|nr:response regulator [Elusimicrobiota bacterium]